MSGYVYRAFDDSGRLLYVGCTVDVETRFATHAATAAWFLFHDRIEVETFPTRELAEEAEAVAIATEHPRWNIKGRAEDHPDGRCSSIRSAPWLTYEHNLWRRLNAAKVERAKVSAQYAALTRSIRAMEVEASIVKAGTTFEDDLTGIGS